ncbi:MAG: hypothetical protein ACOCT9_01375 [archaeon]
MEIQKYKCECGWEGTVSLMEPRSLSTEKLSLYKTTTVYLCPECKKPRSELEKIKSDSISLCELLGIPFKNEISTTFHDQEMQKQFSEFDELTADELKEIYFQDPLIHKVIRTLYDFFGFEEKELTLEDFFEKYKTRIIYIVYRLQKEIFRRKFDGKI